MSEQKEGRGPIALRERLYRSAYERFIEALNLIKPLKQHAKTAQWNHPDTTLPIPYFDRYKDSLGVICRCLGQAELITLNDNLFTVNRASGERLDRGNWGHQDLMQVQTLMDSIFEFVQSNSLEDFSNFAKFIENKLKK